tara:strand:- start:292 stop:501 length:210 start_codon:yes stop_codon:yes gene_type:complete
MTINWNDIIPNLVETKPNNYDLGEEVRRAYWSMKEERRTKNDAQLEHEKKVFRVVDDAGCDVETGKFLG